MSTSARNPPFNATVKLQISLLANESRDKNGMGSEVSVSSSDITVKHNTALGNRLEFCHGGTGVPIFMDDHFGTIGTVCVVDGRACRQRRRVGTPSVTSRTSLASRSSFRRVPNANIV